MAASEIINASNCDDMLKTGGTNLMELVDQKSRTVVSVVNSWENLPLLLTTNQVSAVLGYSTLRIRELCNAGRIPNIREGRHFRIPKEALHDWVIASSNKKIMN